MLAVSVGDTVRLKKPHPCGSTDWKVYRMGADIGIRCLGCSHTVLIERRELEKRLRSVTPASEDKRKPAWP